LIGVSVGAAAFGVSVGAAALGRSASGRSASMNRGQT